MSDPLRAFAEIILEPAMYPGDLRWQDRALCAQVTGDMFFPEKGEPSAAAKRVCRICEVRAECLEYALEHDERFGVWGGMSERERRRLKREGANPALQSREAVAA